MGTLWFDSEADEALTRLEADPSRRRLLARVRVVLDLLEAEPGNETLRRIRFSTQLWCVTVVAGDDVLVVLWEPHPNEANDVVVQYIGPASFA